jgi:hypothetical protein
MGAERYCMIKENSLTYFTALHYDRNTESDETHGKLRVTVPRKENWDVSCHDLITPVTVLAR